MKPLGKLHLLRLGSKCVTECGAVEPVFATEDLEVFNEWLGRGTQEVCQRCLKKLVPVEPPAPIKPPKYMPDDMLMLALGLILSLCRGNPSLIRSQIQDLYPRVPHTRRGSLRQLVRSTKVEAVLEQTIKLYEAG